tara:strand:- start:60 stop:1397 length:1338 start_codon:yes stop_codon:yes gene_type:complete
LKSKTAFLCSACGNDFPKWNGQCPSCKEWGTLSEFKITKNKKKIFNPKESHALNDILNLTPAPRMKTGLEEVDRVLGGGILPGSLILLGGNPGVGKSTLSLHICSGLEQKVLYFSAEESEEQVAIRSRRLGIKTDNLFLSSESDINGMLIHIDRINPKFIIVDSIQTILNSELDSLPGSPSQIRDCGQKFLEISKNKNISILVVGHVTKEGTIAGPKMLEHMVDTVLYLEGDDRYDHRILRAAKNRFGATHEVGIFQMDEMGLSQIKNPSEMFLEERSSNVPGTSIYPSLEGTRPILIEVQALVTNANYNSPQRNVTGFDYKRLGMLMAVLEKRIGLAMTSKDIFVNLVGGLRIDDPAADLSIIAAVASSMMEKSIDTDVILCGEVGLSGELRSVNNLNHRVNEAASLGFKKAIIPSYGKDKVKNKSINLHAVKNVKDAFKVLFS